MRPTEHGFVGPLAGELEEYIRFKASMGRHGATRVRVLRSFDRHCLEHGAVRLERGVVERWIAHRIDANPGGCRSWFSYIRDFGRWMRLAHDPDAYVLSDQWKAGSPRPTPYLLTDREAALFLRAAGTLESPSPWAWQSRAFFMLMACCGLRTREVRRLAVGHVDHKARSIDVVDSKAGRSRRLPVGDEVAAELLECDQRSRERFGDDRPAFFVTSTGVFRQVGVSCLVMYFFGFRQLHAFSLFFRLRGGVPAEHEGLTDAAALAGELEEPPVVHDAVDDRCGEFVVREDRAPFTELDVRGEYDAPSFVAARDDPVEQARPVDVEGYVAELVQYDQVGTADVPEHRLERAVAFGLAQLEDELGGLMEPHAQPHVDRLHAQPDREMCLSAPGLAVEHQVLRARDETEP